MIKYHEYRTNERDYGEDHKLTNNWNPDLDYGKEYAKMNNINFKINQEDKSVNIKCNISDYLSGKIVKYIKAARRMQAAKIIIEIDNQYVVKDGEKR